MQRILQQLGIDIFKDLRYNAWVMRTIWGRIITNQQEHVGFDGRQIRDVGSLWRFHNHSCEPNAQMGRMVVAISERVCQLYTRRVY